MSSAASSPSADIWVAAGSRLLVSELSGIEMSARLSVNSNVCRTDGVRNARKTVSELKCLRNFQRIELFEELPAAGRGYKQEYAG